MRHKKRITKAEITAATAAILALLVLIVLALGPLKELAKGGWQAISGSKDKINDVTNPDFIPYDYGIDMTTEERSARDSMTGLITAINALVTGKDVNSYGSVNPDDVPFDYYTVSYSAELELREGGLNDYRKWMFSRRIDLSQDADAISAETDKYIHANYYYGTCTDSNEGWVNCESFKTDNSGECKCDDEDDFGTDKGKYPTLTGYLDGAESKLTYYEDAKKENLAPLKEINTVYNIQLYVHYKDGTECTVNTKTTNTDKLTNPSYNDLLTWGAAGEKGVDSCYTTGIGGVQKSQKFESGDGCDRNGNGIQGGYGPKFINNPNFDTARKILDYTVGPDQAVLVTEESINKYFPNGKVDENIGTNGEGCLDSPTWLQCSGKGSYGIRIYYCGKTGYTSSQVAGGNEQNYYFGKDSNGKTYSLTGIKFKTQISKAADKDISSINRNEKEIDIRESNAQTFKNYFIGAANYAKEYDLDILTSLATLATGGAATGASALSMRELDDPAVYCHGGLKIGNSSTVVKCNAETSCGVCGFELPQNVSKDKDDFMGWIAGYGDPKYVVYYEAFPAGEESAWELSELDFAMSAVAMTSVATNFGMPIGGFVLKQGKRAAKYFGKTYAQTPVLGRAIKGVAWMGRLVTKTDGTLTRVKNVAFGGIDKATRKIAPDFYEKMFKNADAIKNVEKEALERMGMNLDEVTQAILNGAVKSDDLIAKKIVKDEAEYLSLTEEVLAKRLKDAGYEDDVIEATWTNAQADFILSHPSVKAQAEKAAADYSKMGLLKESAYTSAAGDASKIALFIGAGVALAKEDSMNQKFLPLGANSIGMKEPYKGEFATGNGLPSLEDGVNKYILMLRRDRFIGGAGTDAMLNQRDVRFYLASPCKTNLAITKVTKQCLNQKVKTDEGKEIKPYDYPTGKAEEKYGKVPFLSYTVDTNYANDNPSRYENAVKECVDKSTMYESLTSVWESPLGEVDAVVINPVPYGKNWDEGNFCYGGSHELENAAQLGIIAGAIGAGVLTESAATPIQAGLCTTGILCGGALFVEVVQRSIDTSVDLFSAWLENQVAIKTKWPNH